jgi:5'-3' exonuclease
MNSQLLLVDGSYFCFNRYHAVKRWWSFQPESKDALLLPSQSKLFIDKFRSTFIPSLLAYRTLHAGDDAQIYVARDGSQVWRHELTDDYKAGRDKSKHPDIRYFLDMAYDELFQCSHIMGVLFHAKLEADDCIALSVRRLRELELSVPVTILTSDHDYLQLLDKNTNIFDMENRNLRKSKKCYDDPKLDLFCKIVSGDKSDNIAQVFPRVGPKTAAKLFRDPGALDVLFAKHPDSRRRFKHNEVMIDFSKIPPNLAADFFRTNLTPFIPFTQPPGL